MNAVSIPASEELEVLSPSCIEIVQIAILVCSKHDMIRLQACNKLKQASKSPWDGLAASNSLQIIAKQSTNAARIGARGLPVRKLTR
ncbi:hypothetical protein AVEN_104316-1 [Araneus ventricosus]|uniref:Uncharacterized protein n=2 Tax=Araneus ventricosus TaxID=182803 RepID=A0A4Y2BX73_ARAVE|nr:hypothetical protein AVEN_104316-1 [Araneus ventricosus]